MKHVKKQLSIISMLVVLFALMFTSCSNDKEEGDIICKVSVISGEGGTAILSENEVVSGWKVTLTATPNEGYSFVNWTVDGVEVSKENPYTATILQNTQFTANFERGVNTENGHEYIDLGLPSGIKWATCNVGATTPEEYGDYFAWGEIEPKIRYSKSTYKYYDGKNYTKYCTDSDYGTVDNKTTLELTDDAAHVNCGGNWRMPTIEEQKELLNTSNCTWVWTTQNGVKGYKVTSKKNGNSIFLPAAGYYDGDILFEGNSYGDYWSSSLDPTYDAAFGMDFEETYIDWYGKGGRAYGRPVRAVCP